MSGVNSHNSSNEFIVAGSFSDDVATVRGRGYSVAVASGVYTITLHRKYDGLVSCVATVFNPVMASGENCTAVISDHSVSGGVAGGTITITLLDGSGVIEATPQTDTEVHFVAVLEEDS